ncbi:MAG: hypothetical protein ACE3JU_08205 [Paenibacillus sp.]|uniref:hypothetical protein n=1 Tax=Paenibacillus sp. TaxID=58172 RepID=UPI003B7CA552
MSVVGIDGVLHANDAADVADRSDWAEGMGIATPTGMNGGWRFVMVGSFTAGAGWHGAAGVTGASGRAGVAAIAGGVDLEHGADCIGAVVTLGATGVAGIAG